ncbi:putative exported alanine-rich protein [Sorangium cellulosum So ce56]|uniref:Exported alanine-rich protein n=1 Tax=Sorangium cellulosum (strain So ce56) TaxID=448385 RepID=A9F035_SORC5|nr:exported alanine-rich protein [Sorangium cellulosum]CAN91231.1 putative exported alanine-rich protein [Sorangium cellulosum So ce56]
MSARRLAGVAVAGVLLGACAPIPRPAVLDELDHVRAGAVAAESKRHAPGAFARAEKLRGDALAALESEDRSGAQILGEQAIAAHAHAHALSRVARAEAAETEAKAQRSAGEASLAGLEAEQSRVAAEVDALDMRTKVARDAQPVVPSGKADADREKARLAAARSLALQARLLCGAARLLIAPAPQDSSQPASASPAGPQPAGASPAGPQPASASPAGPQPGSAELATQLEGATAAIKKLDAELAEASASTRAIPAPIDQASRARAGCLAALTAARRAATPVTRAPGAGDALLAELSAAGTWSPVRDDRGIVVTLRGLFAGNALTKAGEARLRDLALVATAHPSFPVAVVVHTDREIHAREEPAWAARADAVVRALGPAQGATAAGAPAGPSIAPFLAGSASPVVDPGGSERARNARVEIIFVTPETL